jgi:hypothetical protein
VIVVTSPRRARHHPLVLLVGHGHGHGPARQHQRDIVLDPLPPAQPRVVQHRVVGETEQAALIDEAHEETEQRALQSRNRVLGPGAGRGFRRSVAC